MRLHRFLINQTFSEEVITVTDPQLLRQWRLVLRLRVGSQLILIDDRGSEARAEFLDLSEKQAVLRLDREPNTPQTIRPVRILYCAILKRENFELVVQKATEVGITIITPILTERTIKQNLNFERLGRIIDEAVEQSGRRDRPRLEAIIDLPTALKLSTSQASQRWFCDGTGQPIITSLPNHDQSAALFIGPEGGFSSQELLDAQEAGLHVVSFGQQTLRAETAAIIGSYLLYST